MWSPSRSVARQGGFQDFRARCVSRAYAGARALRWGRVRETSVMTFEAVAPTSPSHEKGESAAPKDRDDVSWQTSVKTFEASPRSHETGGGAAPQDRDIVVRESSVTAFKAGSPTSREGSGSKAPQDSALPAGVADTDTGGSDDAPETPELPSAPHPLGLAPEPPAPAVDPHELGVEGDFVAALCPLRGSGGRRLGFKVEQFASEALYISAVEEGDTVVGAYNKTRPEHLRIEAGQYIASVDGVLGRGAVDLLVRFEETRTAEVRVTVRQPRVFRAHIERDGMPLGIRVRYDTLGASLYVAGIEAHGAAFRQGVDLAVGDRIVSVSGREGPSGVLLDALKASETVDLVVSRPSAPDA